MEINQLDYRVGQNIDFGFFKLDTCALSNNPTGYPDIAGLFDCMSRIIEGWNN